jgi:hypothetical protein
LWIEENLRWCFGFESFESTSPFFEDGIGLGGGPAAGRILVFRGSIAGANTAGEGGRDGDSSAVGAVSHGSGPNEVVFAPASVVPGVGVNPGGEGCLMVGRVGL